jgi:hypothetical protein
VRQGQTRPLAAQDVQARGHPLQGRRHSPFRFALHLLPVLPAQLRLDGRHRGPHQGEHVRTGHVVTAGHIDGAQQRAGQWVVHGGRRAAPRLDRAAVVLAAVDLDGVVDGEGRARGVRADDLLGPPGAFDEVHAGRPAAQPRIALDPQHPAAGVGDRDDHLVVLGVLDEEPPDHRHHRRQGVGLAIGEQVAVQEVDRRHATVGIDTAAQGPPPGIADHHAHGLVGKLGAGDQPFVGSPQSPDVVRAGPPRGERQPGIHDRRHEALRHRWLMSRAS